MSPPTLPDDDWLDTVLRAQGREHRAGYLNDDGFTARVMGTLPPPVEALPRWRRPLVTAMWAVAAAGAAIALPDAMLEVGRETFRLLAAQPLSLSHVGLTLAGLGAATWAAAAWALRAD